MSYPTVLQESLAKVEASRSRRLDQIVPRLTAEEREDILQNFHPDYIADAFRTLSLGPNRGDRVPVELADVLEGPALLKPGAIDLNQPYAETDVLVVGGGGAGASSALLAQDQVA